jgi:hypothetical protein
VAFAEQGFPVVGIDVDGRKVAALNRGESYVQDVPSARLAGDRSQGLRDGTTSGLEIKWGGEGRRLLQEMGRSEDVYLLRAIPEGLKRVSTSEELRQIYQRMNCRGC